MKGCLVFVVGLVVGGLLVVGAQVFLVQPSPLPETSPSQSDLVILFTNEYLTRMLRTYAAQTNAPVSLQGVEVRGNASDQLNLAGDVSLTARGATLTSPVRVILHPTVEGNTVRIEVVQAQVGTLTIPGNVFQGIERPINRQINQTLQGAPYQIVGVNTTVEGLVVKVNVKK